MQFLLMHYNPITFVLVETWLCKEISSDSLGFKDYNIFRRDRDWKGGVLIGIRRNVSVELINQSEDTEVLSVDLRVHNRKLRIIGAYIPHFGYYNCI